ncbi:MAG: AsmA family protein [Acidobacteriaceae bacterium]
MKRMAWVTGVLVLVLLLLAVTVPLFVNTDTFLPILQQRLSAALGRQVTIGNLSLNIFEGGLTAGALTIADDPAYSARPFLQAKQLRVGVDLGLLLFHKQLEITKLVVIDPEIQLLQNASGQWNYATLGAGHGANAPQKSAQPTAFTVDSLRIVNGQATVGTVPSVTAPRVYSGINLTLGHFGFLSQFPFQLTAHLPGDGTVEMAGVAGPINATDTTLTPFQGSLKVQHIDPVAAGFLDRQAGISGLLDATANLASNGVKVTSSGNVVGNHMLFSTQGRPAAIPMKLEYAVAYDLASSIGEISRAVLSAGQVAAYLNGRFQMLPARSQVQLQLEGRNLSIDALQSLLPAFGVNLPNGSVLQGGVLSTSLAIAGPVNGLVITGPLTVNNTRLSGFDLGSQLKAIAALNRLGGGTGNVTEVQTLQADLRDTQQALTLTNILAVVPSLGQATGSGTVYPGGQLNFNMVAKFSSAGGLGAIANGVMAFLPGGYGQRVQNEGVPLTVRGTTSNPVFNVDASVFTQSAPSNQQQTQPNPLGNALKGLFGQY